MDIIFRCAQVGPPPTIHPSISTVRLIWMENKTISKDHHRHNINWWWTARTDTSSGLYYTGSLLLLSIILSPIPKQHTWITKFTFNQDRKRQCRFILIDQMCTVVIETPQEDHIRSPATTSWWLWGERSKTIINNIFRWGHGWMDGCEFCAALLSLSKSQFWRPRGHHQLPGHDDDDMNDRRSHSA